MSAPPQRPPTDSKEVEKLLETHNAREAFQILATKIILANERVQNSPRTSRAQTESRRMTESHHEARPKRVARSERVQMEERKITLSAKDLEDLKSGRYLRFQLPSEDEARYWLNQWREAKRRGQEAAQRQTLTAGPEVRE